MKEGQDWITRDEARKRIYKYCAYSERAPIDVRQRLMKMRIPPEWVEELIVELMQENFLNEWRYAEIFIHSKLKYNSWGRNKMYEALRMKGISEHVISSCYEQMDKQMYIDTLKKLIEKKQSQNQDFDPYIRQQKLIRYLLGKGYLYNEIKSALEDQ